MTRRPSSSFLTVFALCALIVFIQAADPAAARDGQPLDKRIAEQSRQIDLRQDAGRLTDYEAAILRDNLALVRNLDADIRGGGKENKKKRQRLHKMLDTNEKMIHKKPGHPVRRMHPPPGK